MNYRFVSFRNLIALGFVLLTSGVLLLAYSASAQVTNAYTSPNGYVIFGPTGWNIYQSEYNTLSGEKEERVIVTQDTDITSRTTKYVAVYSGSSQAVFGLRKAVLDQITKDELVDFYIDQAKNSHIDYHVTKTITKGEGNSKVYVIEANFAVPGHRAFTTTLISFKGDTAYFRQSFYLGSFSNYAQILQGVLDGVIFQ